MIDAARCWPYCGRGSRVGPCSAGAVGILSSRWTRSRLATCRASGSRSAWALVGGQGSRRFALLPREASRAVARRVQAPHRGPDEGVRGPRPPARGGGPLSCQPARRYLVVTAPAGFGKTSLVKSTARSCDTPRAAACPPRAGFSSRSPRVHRILRVAVVRAADVGVDLQRDRNAAEARPGDVRPAGAVDREAGVVAVEVAAVARRRRRMGRRSAHDFARLMSRPLVDGLKSTKKRRRQRATPTFAATREPLPISCAASGEARQTADLTAAGGRRGQLAEMRFWCDPSGGVDSMRLVGFTSAIT